MLLLLPLFQAVCGNKIKKTQSFQCYYCYLCSRVFVWKNKNESYQCYYYHHYSGLLVGTKQRKNKVPNVTIVTFVPGCLLEEREKRKLQMLILLLLFQAVCENSHLWLPMIVIFSNNLLCPPLGGWGAKWMAYLMNSPLQPHKGLSSWRQCFVPHECDLQIIYEMNEVG